MANKTGKHYNVGNNKGKKRDEESVKRGAEKRKRGAFFTCLTCGEQFWRAPSAIKKGQNKYCCKACYFQSAQNKSKKPYISEIRKLATGNKSPSWKGGITPTNLKIRNSKNYKDWRQEVFLRDNYTCQDCGAKSRSGNYVFLHAHHICSFSEREDLRFNIDNGITLCKSCHYRRHRKL